MKNFLVVCALVALASVAQAQTTGTVENGGAVAGSNSGASSGSVSNAENRAISGSDSRSAAQGVADTSSGAAAGANANLHLNIEAAKQLPETRSISVTDIRHSGTQTIKSAPGIAMSGPASGPCTGRSGGIGGSWLGGGVGINYAEVDRGCALRENARMFAMILPTLAGEDQAEARAMLMDTLRTMHAEQNTITKK